MRLAFSFICFILFSLSSHTQTVVIDVQYQPNTTYQWTKTTSTVNWTELFGDPGYIESMARNGYDSFGEYEARNRISVLMKTGNRDKSNIPFVSTITEKTDSIDRRSQMLGPRPSNNLEVDDLVYYGRINHFHKMEIDSIIGVDSLAEKNKAFALLDGIHRSLTYPKDTFSIGKEVVKESIYRRTGANSDEWKLLTTYRLGEITDGSAIFEIEMSVVPPTTGADLSDANKTKIDLDGKGTLVYEIDNKLVRSYTYTKKSEEFFDSDFVSRESKYEFHYNWTIAIVE